MSNRRRANQERSRFAFEKRFRPRCTDCGSSRLRWLTVAESERPEFWAEGLDLPVGDVLECAVWECQVCGHGGVFGPWEEF